MAKATSPSQTGDLTKVSNMGIEARLGGNTHRHMTPFTQIAPPPFAGSFHNNREDFASLVKLTSTNGDEQLRHPVYGT